jgi:transcriptional regulator with XRE-family HTH domain
VDSGGSPFGARLRQWRKQRGVSQLALAGKIGSTSRHVSFLETGRSRPSAAMVLRLGEALDVPLRERNQMLHAAGLAARFPEASLGSAGLAPFRAAIDSLLSAHMPYPAMVLDRHWNVLVANGACDRLYGHGLAGTNIVRRFLADPRAREMVVNWPQIAAAALGRLRRECERTPFDDTLAELLAQAQAALGDLPDPAPGPTADFVLCPWYRVGARIVKIIGVAAHFDATTDITLNELRIELSYPLDQASDDFFRLPTSN